MYLVHEVEDIGFLISHMTVIQVDIIELYLFNRYNQRRDSMIIGFKDKETERIFYRGYLSLRR